MLHNSSLLVYDLIHVHPSDHLIFFPLYQTIHSPRIHP